jgi:hypothetical protein
MYKIFGVGHRFLADEDQVRANIGSSLDYFISTYSDIECVSNLACGADMIFIEEAIIRNCKIKIILPFQIDEYEKDFDKDSLIIFRSLISKINFSIYSILSSRNDFDRILAYQAAGRSLIMESDAILAIWDGEEGQGLGGTKDHIDFAINLNKNIHWLKTYRKENSIKNNISNEKMLIDQFNNEDILAQKFKFKYNLSWACGIFFGLFTIFSIEINFNYVNKIFTHLFLSSLAVVSLIISYYLLTFYANKVKFKYIRTRLSAEKLRAQLWKINLDNFFPKIYNESKEQIFNLFNDSKRRQLWIQIEDQLKYQQKRNAVIDKKMKPFLLFLKVLRYCFFCIFIGLFSLYAYDYFNFSQSGITKLIEDLLGFLWMSTPPIYAAIEGYIHFSDFKKTKKITAEIINLFKQYKLDLNKSIILAEFELIEKKLFEAFTFENIEWYNDEKNKRLELKI